MIERDKARDAVVGKLSEALTEGFGSLRQQLDGVGQRMATREQVEHLDARMGRVEKDVSSQGEVVKVVPKLDERIRALETAKDRVWGVLAVVAFLGVGGMGLVLRAIIFPPAPPAQVAKHEAAPVEDVVRPQRSRTAPRLTQEQR